MRHIAYDTETTGLMPYQGDVMFSYSLADWNLKTSVHRLDGDITRRGKNRRKLIELFEDQGTSKVMWYGKHDLAFTAKFLKHIERQPIEDVFTMIRLLRSNLTSFELKDVAWLICGYSKDDERRVLEAAGGKHNFHLVPEAIMDEYQRGDARRTMLLYRFARPLLQQMPSNTRDLYEWEKKLIWVTKDIEARGVRVSFLHCRRLIVELDERMRRSVSFLEKEAGRFVNPVGDQARDYLYNDLKMPVVAHTQKTGRPRLQKEDLLTLRQQVKHPALDYILEYRSCQRGKANLESYMELSSPGGRDWGILHPDVNPYAAPTGRESCSRPNLQNVEKERSLTNPFPIPARRVFFPKPGYVNFHMDFSGIEIRLLVHFSEDERLIEALRQGVNLHDMAAKFWFGKRYTSANPIPRMEMYDATKNANFAIPYGASIPTVAHLLQQPVREVASRWPEYAEMFPGYVGLQKRIIARVRQDGYITTTYGRKVYVPRSKPYMGVSYIVQGTAADIFKITQVRVDEFLEAETGGDVGLVLPNHDELIGEYPRERSMKRLRPLLRDMKQVMINFPELRVPLDVGVKIATQSWADAQEVKLT